MMNSKYLLLFLHIALLVLLLSSYPSSAHNKTNESSTGSSNGVVSNGSPKGSSNGVVSNGSGFSSNSNGSGSSSKGSSSNGSGSSSNSNGSGSSSKGSSSNGAVQGDFSASVGFSFKGSFSKVFAFGGSFTDTGNAHLVGGLSPFVGTLVSHSSHGSPYKTTGQRLSNGRLVVDYMCESLGVPYLPPYKDTSLDFSHGVNFAIAGSTALSSDYFSNHNIGHSLMWGSNPLSYQTQIDWFNKYLLEVDCKGKSDTDCRVCLEDTLFWIGEMGTNDYARIYGVNNVPVKWVTEQAVGHVCRLMKTLLERGAKYIVVQGLPPTGCSPLQMLLSTEKDRDNMGCAASGNEMTKAHNVLLQQRLEEYRKQYPQCTIVYADYWNAFRQIFTNYKKYQFEEPCKACCGAGGGPLNFILNSLCGDHGTSTCKNPDQYISWDGVHFTEAMHRHVADLFLNRGYCQPSFDHIINTKRGLTKSSDQGSSKPSGPASSDHGKSSDHAPSDQGSSKPSGPASSDHGKSSDHAPSDQGSSKPSGPASSDHGKSSDHAPSDHGNFGQGWFKSSDHSPSQGSSKSSDHASFGQGWFRSNDHY